MANEELMQKMQEQMIKFDAKVGNLHEIVENMQEQMISMQTQINGLDKSMMLQANKIDGALKRIDEQAKLTETVQELAGDIKLLIMEQKATDKKIDKLTTDVDEMKQEPANKWKEVTGKVLIVILTAAVTFILARIGIK